MPCTARSKYSLGRGFLCRSARERLHRRHRRLGASVKDFTAGDRKSDTTKDGERENANAAVGTSAPLYLHLGLRWLHADGAPRKSTAIVPIALLNDNSSLLIHPHRTIDGSGWFGPRHHIRPGLRSNGQSHQIGCFRRLQPARQRRLRQQARQTTHGIARLPQARSQNLPKRDTFAPVLAIDSGRA